MSEGKEKHDKLEEIFRLYSDLMFYVAYGILHNEQDAEDAVLAALWKIFQNIEKTGEPDCPKTKRFVVIVTERQAIDLYRKNARQKSVSMDELEKFPERTVPDYDVGSAVASAILRLPVSYREVILLRFSEGYSVKEIAEILDYSVSKVEKLISRGKARLKKLLREEGIEYE